MKKKNVIKKLVINNRAGWVTIAGMIMILLLSASCASQNNKQALSENGGDEEIECRWIVPTGSTLREKVCATKAAWAEKDRQAKRDADRFYNHTVDEMNQNPNSFEVDQ